MEIKVLGTFSHVLRMSRLRVLADLSGSLVTTADGKVLSDIDVLVTANSRSGLSVPMPEERRHWSCAALVAMEACSLCSQAVAMAWEKAPWCRRCHSGLLVLWPGAQAGGGNCLQGGVERMWR